MPHPSMPSGGQANHTDSPRPFVRTGWWAWRVKTLIQMLIGALTALGALAIAVWSIAHNRAMDAGTDALGATAAGLAVAAAIELAYTLFTPGPDEAVNPLLLGLAAFGFLEISKGAELDLQTTGAVLVLAIAIAVLFTVRQVFGLHEDDNEKAHPPTANEEERSESAEVGSSASGDPQVGGTSRATHRDDPCV